MKRINNGKNSVALLSLLAVITLMALSGCSTRLGHFTVASTQNVQNLDYTLGDNSKQHVEGSSCIHNIFIIPVGHFDDRLQRAMDDAITNGHELGISGDILVNVRIDHRSWTAILYGQDCVVVEGDLVKIGKK
jgi:hypothetical protein